MLLLNLKDLKDSLEKKVGFRCEVAVTEHDALEKITFVSKQVKSGHREFFSHIMICIDGNRIVADRFKKKVLAILKEQEVTTECKFYAFASKASEQVQKELAEAGYSYFKKP